MQPTTILPPQTKPASGAGWKGGEIFMNDTEIKKMLEKQLQLLSKHSEKASEETIWKLSEAMAQIAKILMSI